MAGDPGRRRDDDDPMAPADPDIDDRQTAISAGSFETLVAAIQAAGLVEALSAEGPFTVFAPTDAAFAALPDGTVESLLRPENRAQLEAILTYHVIAGRLRAEDVVARDELVTLQSLDDGRATYLPQARLPFPRSGGSRSRRPPPPALNPRPIVRSPIPR